MNTNTLTRPPRFLRKNGINYRIKLNGCRSCKGAIQIQERVAQGAITDTEAYCQTCGRSYYGPSLQPAGPIA